jgi:chemotaxis-related protein WspB
MLMLLFYVGDDRYAIESSRVVEVIPRVALKTLHGAPEYIPGLFNYRSQLVPVIDLHHLIRGNPCRPHLSTRIILVNYQRHDSPEGDFLSFAERDSHAAVAPDYTNARLTPTSQILGLMAERVTETLNKSETEFVAPGIQVDAAPYLGEMITDEQGMIQFVRVEYLLPESQRTYLLPSQED